MITTLRAKGYTIVMGAELPLRRATGRSLLVMEHGRIVGTLRTSELQAKMPVLNQLLGV